MIKNIDFRETETRTFSFLKRNEKKKQSFPLKFISRIYLFIFLVQHAYDVESQRLCDRIRRYTRVSIKDLIFSCFVTIFCSLPSVGQRTTTWRCNSFLVRAFSSVLKLYALGISPKTLPQTVCFLIYPNNRYVYKYTSIKSDNYFWKIRQNPLVCHAVTFYYVNIYRN